MPLVLRTLLAILFGIVLGAICVGLVQTASHHLIYAMPETLNTANFDELARFMDEVPLQAKLSIVVSWALGLGVGSHAAARLAAHKSLAGAKALAVLLAFTVMNFFIIPHPLWMMLCPIILAFLIWLWIKRYSDRAEQVS